MAFVLYILKSNLEKQDCCASQKDPEAALPKVGQQNLEG